METLGDPQSGEEFADLAALLKSGEASKLGPVQISPAEKVVDAETFLRSYLRDLGHPALKYLAQKQLQAFRRALKEEEN